MSSSSSSPSHDPRDAAPADPPPGYPDLGPEPVEGVRLLRAPAVPTAVVRATCVPMATIAGFFDSAFGTAFPALFAAGVTPAGPAFALYTRTTEEPEPAADLEIGFPLARPLPELHPDEPTEIDGMQVIASELPAGDVAVTSHLGSYDGLGQAWGEFMGAIGAMGRAPGSPFWEVYVTEPSPDMDPATLRTDLFCPAPTPDDAA
ncbi:GyrI-like domain-containing protein [Dietzia maris]|uniref:GyrI-like domain-containing protein n=1 Tax=Dietzia maris TaxID=37915 RepID=UPI00223B60CD|nr:GyrI-like domain-containing protein [Dietzia maris]MCT1432806.1 GyrI-like domain-containing protein [Dietzia maris]MCT1520329.1 GyrI-like domain-containing protein [Dietzia maris]